MTNRRVKIYKYSPPNLETKRRKPYGFQYFLNREIKQKSRTHTFLPKFWGDPTKNHPLSAKYLPSLIHLNLPCELWLQAKRAVGGWLFFSHQHQLSVSQNESFTLSLSLNSFGTGKPKIRVVGLVGFFFFFFSSSWNLQDYTVGGVCHCFIPSILLGLFF